MNYEYGMPWKACADCGTLRPGSELRTIVTPPDKERIACADPDWCRRRREEKAQEQEKKP